MMYRLLGTVHVVHSVPLLTMTVCWNLSLFLSLFSPFSPSPLSPLLPFSPSSPFSIVYHPLPLLFPSLSSFLPSPLPFLSSLPSLLIPLLLSPSSPSLLSSLSPPLPSLLFPSLLLSLLSPLFSPLFPLLFTLPSPFPLSLLSLSSLSLLSLSFFFLSSSPSLPSLSFLPSLSHLSLFFSQRNCPHQESLQMNPWPLMLHLCWYIQYMLGYMYMFTLHTILFYYVCSVLPSFPTDVCIRRWYFHCMGTSCSTSRISASILGNYSSSWWFCFFS